MHEVQVPYLSTDQAEDLLSSYREKTHKESNVAKLDQTAEMNLKLYE